MYRPGIDPQYRSNTTVPPPPPQGMMNFAPQRPLPPPIHGRSYSSSQFSYAPGPPPPPMAPQVPRFSSSNLAIQSAPPGFYTAPFVPPLPSELPPPPPSSPPPSPPPPPSEALMTSDQVPVEGSRRNSSSSDSLPAVKGVLDARFHPGFPNIPQQTSPFQHLSADATNREIKDLDSEDKISQPRQYNDWNATYQDTLDDEAGSPTTSDMDTDMDVAGQLREVYVKPMFKQDTHPAKETKESGPMHDRHSHLPASAMPCTVDEPTSSCLDIENVCREPGGTQIEKASRFENLSSPQTMNLMIESRKSDGFSMLIGGSEKLGAFEMDFNSNPTLTSSQRSESAAGIGGVASSRQEEEHMVGKLDDISMGLSKMQEIAQQQDNKTVPTMDEFGRLAQEAVSDGDVDDNKHDLPIDEFGRVIKRGASGSDSDGTKHTSKRKRSYSSSRSRSRSRSRVADRGRGRGRTRSSSRSRSRSWSWSSRSRSNSRSRSRSTSSRSPARSSRMRRQSYSRSPRRKMRWSRSRSRSPEWRRSYSRTPPRDMRWSMGRGDRDWRGDREFGRGRRGGRGGVLNPCIHFARGRCFRGSSCWYPHVSREAMVQDRGTWRRDVERPNLDAAREEFSADQHSRGPWRRDVRTDRPDDFEGGHQDNIGTREKKEFVSNANVSQDDFARDPSFNRPMIPFQQTDMWTPRSADEAKDRQVMAYNKALELVGIPHVPGESITREEPVIHDGAQGHERSDGRTSLTDEIMPDNTMNMSGPPKELTLTNPGDSGTAVPGFEVAFRHTQISMMTIENIAQAYPNEDSKESRVIQDSGLMDQDLNIVEKPMLEKDTLDRETDRRYALEQHAIETHPSKHRNVQNVSEVLEEFDDQRDPNECNVSEGEGELDAVKDATKATGIYSDKIPDAHVPVELEPLVDADPDCKSHEALDELHAVSKPQPVTDSDALEKILIEPEDAAEQAMTDVCKKPKAPSDSQTVVNLEEGSKSDVEAEINETPISHSVNVMEQMDASKISDLSDMEKVCASVDVELPVPSSKEDSAETNISHLPSAPLLEHNPRGPQNTSSSHQGAGILRVPSSVPQYASATQHITGRIPPPGQFQVPAHQQFPAQSYSSTSVQYPSNARDMSQNAQYTAYRLPAIRPVASSPTFDQVARPSTQFSNKNSGLSSVGGWGQSFQSNAPADSFAPSQVFGLPSYGTPARPNLGIPMNGMPFYVANNQGDKYSQHHGAPHSAEQASHWASNSGDQYPQLPRPSSAGGVGHGNSGGYGSAYPGGFVSPNVGGSFSQNHVSSNSGASQTSIIAGSLLPHQPAQNQGLPFLSQSLSQNYRPMNQPAYGSNFPGQPSSQNSLFSNQPPGQVNPVLSSSGNPSFAQLQITMPQGQQDFIANKTYLSEQLQPSGQLGVITANQAMQPGVLSTGQSNTGVSSSLPGQTPGLWNPQASQRPVMPPQGQPLTYSYPLTTIPPLSGLVQVPQAGSLAVQNDQYDPLSDVASLAVAGVSRIALATTVSDGAASGVEKTKVEKASIPLSRLEAAEVDAKTTTEDVGVVENISPENWSPGPPEDDVEGDKSQALSKKSSRGLKMLRTAIADHVKEVLKPTWKEGYMSKEAFKTIAKKAVEKVVANLPNHHIPKSQEKVDQFMKSSRPKISKLVQGYVDKYLKL